jgi:hypothetical protein
MPEFILHALESAVRLICLVETSLSSECSMAHGGQTSVALAWRSMPRVVVRRDRQWANLGSFGAVCRQGPKYLELRRFLAYEAQVGQSNCDALSETKPRASWSKRDMDQWLQEIREFEGQVTDLSQPLGYEWRVESLVTQAIQEHEQAARLGCISPKRKKPTRFWMAHKSGASLFHWQARSVAHAWGLGETALATGNETRANRL